MNHYYNEKNEDKNYNDDNDTGFDFSAAAAAFAELNFLSPLRATILNHTNNEDVDDVTRDVEQIVNDYTLEHSNSESFTSVIQYALIAFFFSRTLNMTEKTIKKAMFLIKVVLKLKEGNISLILLLLLQVIICLMHQDTWLLDI